MMIYFPRYYFVLIFLFSFPNALNVTTLLGLSTMSSPVAGFRPLRLAFSFTQNFSNPLTRTAGGEGPLYDFQEGFGGVRRLVPCDSDLVNNGLDHFGFGQYHGVLHYICG
jgi:hypothetical protein